MATTIWNTYVDGECVELPATIDDIRAALPAERHSEFERAVGAAAPADLHLLLGHWALETRPDIRARDAATFARVEAGDFTGFTAAEDLIE
ncbi:MULTISPECIES: hypothetical protein [Streptomyces]|uniref:Uncharacterized protein n=1 Tax=Streptomyces harbinensis TaxID=1176198 RepID=A0A1I6WBF8_9ACTN|nr:MULTISPECIES: hypothetical protein [Streptomyces]SFT23242.1 hypothetical protein SAMN05444716_1176 [Streptomyces harbinensis]